MKSELWQAYRFLFRAINWLQRLSYFEGIGALNNFKVLQHDLLVIVFQTLTC